VLYATGYSSFFLLDVHIFMQKNVLFLLCENDQKRWQLISLNTGGEGVLRGLNLDKKLCWIITYKCTDIMSLDLKECAFVPMTHHRIHHIYMWKCVMNEHINQADNGLLLSSRYQHISVQPLMLHNGCVTDFIF